MNHFGDIFWLFCFIYFFSPKISADQQCANATTSSITDTSTTRLDFTSQSCAQNDIIHDLWNAENEEYKKVEVEVDSSIIYPNINFYWRQNAECKCGIDAETNPDLSAVFICCPIPIAIRIELERLRADLSNATIRAALDTMYLFDADIFTFLFDTEFRFNIETIYNIDFIFAPPATMKTITETETGIISDIDISDIANRNAASVRKLWLTDCEIDPTIFAAAIRRFTSLVVLNFATLRFLPFQAADKDSDLDVEYIFGEIFAELNRDTISVINFIDCEIRRLNPSNESGFDLRDYAKLRSISFAQNRIEELDIDFFANLPRRGALREVNFAANAIDRIPRELDLPDTVRVFDLSGNRILQIANLQDKMQQFQRNVPLEFLCRCVDPKHDLRQLYIDNILMTKDEIENYVEQKTTTQKDTSPTPTSIPESTPTYIPKTTPISTPTSTPKSRPKSTPTSTPTFTPKSTPTSTPNSRPKSTRGSTQINL